MRQFVSDRRLAIADLFLVFVSGAIWMLKPEWGFWFILIALLPWMLRLTVGLFPFVRTKFDWLVLAFLVTAWVGYWAAYDKTTAWSKVWMVLMAVLFYYALSAQPLENLNWISYLLFGIGVGVAIYFFLTHDFVNLPRKLEFANSIGRWVMKTRPQVNWMPVHPNYVSGIVAITTPFVFYPVWRLRKNNNRSYLFVYTIVFLSLGVAFLALVMATSRGVVMAIVSAGGLWLLGGVVNLNRTRFWLKPEAVFSSLVLIYLSVIIVVLYAGPASSVSAVISGQDNYGTGSRAELFTRSLYFLTAFPITGGGLGSFPGLYSHYMLGIPFFYLPNSHNLFLDIAIEQGVFGGLSFALIFIGSIWYVSRTIVKELSHEMKIFTWLVLFALVIALVHGMVDDYLYNGNGTFLLLVLPGLSMIVNRENTQISNRPNPWLIRLIPLVIIIIMAFKLDKLKSVWYADLGALQTAHVELASFPKGEWAGSKILPKLDQADTTLHAALQFDPNNQTANHYLGLISMLRTDFKSASVYLEEAYKYMPYNRGVIKSLGYCHAWLGNIDQANQLLAKIPEARDELDVYVWWWSTQGREDLSAKAVIMISEMSRK